MADFCNQCAKDHGFDEGDLSTLIPDEYLNDGYLCISVICEGCGETKVDWAGNCINAKCLEKHGLPPT
jgi:hypothetical protein